MRCAVVGCVVVGVMASSALAQPGATEPPAPPPSEAPAPSEPAPSGELVPARDPTSPPATLVPAREPPMTEKLLQSARSAARDGRCDVIPMIGARVRQIDPSYYSAVFVGDPQIASCRQGMPFQPPSSAAVITAPVASYADEDLLPSEIVEVKSPGMALALSLGVTAGGLALTYLGDYMNQHGRYEGADGVSTVGSIAFLVGPTTGHIYAGNTWNTGLKWRLAGLGLGFGGILFALSQCGVFDDCTDAENNAAGVGVVIAVGGVITFTGATIYEIATAGSSARKYNLEYSRRRLQMQIVPMPGRSPGLALAGTF